MRLILFRPLALAVLAMCSSPAVAQSKVDSRQVAVGAQSLDQALAARATLNQAPTGFFWTAAGGVAAPMSKAGPVTVNRQERTFVDAARVNTGDFPATTKSYLEAFEAVRSNPGGYRDSWASLASGSSVGGIGVLGYARTSDAPVDGFQLGEGGAFESINDNTIHQQLATGVYGVTFRLPGAGVCQGCGSVGGELDIANEGNALQIVPANIFDPRGFTTGLQVMSGAADPFAHNASAGITVGNNGAQFLAGQIFAQNAIVGITLDETGRATDGYGSGIRFGNRMGLEWWNTGDPTPNLKIYGAGLTAANAIVLKQDDYGVHVMNGAETQELATVVFVSPATTSAVQLIPGTATTAAGVTASAGDVQISAPSRVVLGKPGDIATTAGAASGKYLTIKGGDGVTYKLQLLSN